MFITLEDSFRSLEEYGVTHKKHLMEWKRLKDIYKELKEKLKDV